MAFLVREFHCFQDFLFQIQSRGLFISLKPRRKWECGNTFLKQCSSDSETNLTQNFLRKNPVASLEWVPWVPRNPDFQKLHFYPLFGACSHKDLKKICFYYQGGTHRFEILTTPLYRIVSFHTLRPLNIGTLGFSVFGLLT